MTEVIHNSSINEKSKQSIFNRIKLIQRYFSNSTLQSKSMVKSSKSILTIQHKTLNDNLLPCQQITSSKSNDNDDDDHHHHDKKNWTMKQFKKHIKINHNNKHQHKSTTLTVIPTRQMITPYSSYSYNSYIKQYHTLKEISSNKNEMINVQTFKPIDDISSLQQSISLSSLSLDDDDDDQNKSYQKITNLDEINDENITVTKFVNDIIKQSDLDKSWLTIDYDNDDDLQQQREQHQQQREQQQQQREQQRGEQQQREQHQNEQQQREQQQREQQQRQLSMSDIYPICTSHDPLNDSLKYFTSLSSNMSIINKKEKHFNIFSSILSKCNNNNDKSLLLKRNLNRLKKFKTLSTMEIDLLLCENRNSSGTFNGHQSLGRNLNRPKNLIVQFISQIEARPLWKTWKYWMTVSS